MDLMIAGLATQVLFTAIFCVLLFIIRRRIGWPIGAGDKRWYMVGECITARLCGKDGG